MDIDKFISNFSKNDDVEFLQDFILEGVLLLIPLDFLIKKSNFNPQLIIKLYKDSLDAVYSEQLFELQQDHLCGQYDSNTIKTINSLDILELYNNSKSKKHFFNYTIYKIEKDKKSRKQLSKLFKRF